MSLIHHMLGLLDDAASGLPRWARGGILAGVFLFPALGVMLAFGLIPMLYAVYMSLYDLSGAEAVFVGGDNYGEALRGAGFWNSFFVTAYYAIGTVPVTIVLSFMVALGLFRIRVLSGFFRTAFFLPYVTSIVAAAMVWRVLLEPSYGLTNQVLEALGLPGQSWLLEPRGVLHLLTNGAVPVGAGPSLALCCVIVFEIWRSSGFMVVVFLAGLAAIPKELEEAARVDGASAWESMRSVTLPMLSPTIFFLAVIGVIGAFQAFSGFYALTGGRGPLDSTQNLTVYIYSNLYEYGRLGYGAAVSVLLFGATALLTVLQWRLARRRVFYQ